MLYVIHKAIGSTKERFNAEVLPHEQVANMLRAVILPALMPDADVVEQLGPARERSHPALGAKGAVRRHAVILQHDRETLPPDAEKRRCDNYAVPRNSSLLGTDTHHLRTDNQLRRVNDHGQEVHMQPVLKLPRHAAVSVDQADQIDTLHDGTVHDHSLQVHSPP